MKESLSIVLPARNEAGNITTLISELRQRFPDAEIILVNDGSTDDTAEKATEARAQVVSHPYSMGNGAAIKTGARAATGEVIVFMDADGQHDPDDIGPMLTKLEQGFDMVVGARTRDSQASFGRLFANIMYNRLASLMTGHRIADLTSGFRAVRAEKFRRFLYLLPNGFSYPTTITMAFFRAGHSVAYVSISARRRTGTSHIRPLTDGVRFFLIIFRVGTLYSPLKLFLPISVFFFVLGLAHYIYTYIAESRFTNMSALLFITALLIFLIGLISEQITALLYQRQNDT